jgi:hypothetical protein
MDWKPKPVHELVELIIQHIKGQYKDVERALIGRGPYTLHEKFKGSTQNPSTYCAKDEAERRKIFVKFMARQGKKKTLHQSRHQMVCLRFRETEPSETKKD